MSNNTNSDDFDLDFSKKSEKCAPEPISRPEELHTPVRRNSPPPRRSPNKKGSKYKPPKETIWIYAAVAVVILMIVTVVFIISLNSGKDTESGTTDNDSSSSSAYLIGKNSSDSSGDSSDMSDSSGSSASKPDPIVVPADYVYKYYYDDLFIGDSIFTGLNGYGILSTDNVAAEIGFTPSGAHYNTLSDYEGTAVDYAGYIKPKHINIMLGSNCLGSDASIPNFIKDYKDLISALKEITPNSKICVISVPPITKDSSTAKSAGITKKMIDDANKQLNKMCAEINVSYFDLNTHLSDDEGYFKEEYAEFDGLHFKIKTYNVLLAGVEQLWEKSGL